MTQGGRVELKALLLIASVKSHPVLYDQTKASSTPRSEKQRLWDVIATAAGYLKTEEAKSKWRSLNTYLRLHLDNVAKKTLRRYVPNTGNPADKYMQLDDWPYYKHINFMTPYLKKKPASEELVAMTSQKMNGNVTVRLTSTTNSSAFQSTGVKAEVTHANPPCNEITAHDRNLKAFFDAMLGSTQQLPLFHQERVKRKLLLTILQQKT